MKPFKPRLVIRRGLPAMLLVFSGVKVKSKLRCGYFIVSFTPLKNC